MARKKSYIKVAEDTLVTGENSKEVYEELSKVQLGDMKTRIEVIEAETAKMEAEIGKRQTKGGTGDNEATIQEMINIAKELNGEQAILEAFPKVDKKVKIIKTTKSRAEKRKAEEMAVAQKRLEEAERKEKELAEKEADFDEQIKEGQEAIKTIKSKRIREAMEKEVADLQAGKDKLQEGKKAIKREVIEAREGMKVYTEGKSEIDAVIKKCEDPWNNILKGMGWKAVASLSEEDLKQKLAMPKKKEEKQDESRKNDEGKKDIDKKDDKGKDGDGKGQSDDGQGRNNGGGSGPQGPQVNPPELPEDPEPELDPEEDELEEPPVPEKLTLGERFRNWREKRREIKQAKMKNKAEMIKMFSEKYGRKPGFIDRLALRFSLVRKLFRRDSDEVELSFEEQLVAQVPEKDEEKEKIGKEIIQRNKLARQSSQNKVAELEKGKTEEEKRLEQITSEIGKMSSSEIQEAKETWGDILHPDVIERAYEAAVLRETKGIREAERESRTEQENFRARVKLNRGTTPVVKENNGTSGEPQRASEVTQVSGAGGEHEGR